MNRITPSILVVSPHYDDAPLSVGGLMQQRPDAFGVLTVFGDSAWANGRFSPDERAAISERRRSEDVAACRALGVTAYQSLAFADSRSRGRQPFSDEAEPALSAEVERAIARVLDGWSATRVLFPLGLGDHIDHLLLADVAGHVARRGGADVAFYEDLPYAAFYSLEEIAFRVANVAAVLGHRLEMVHVPFGAAALSAKRRALESYESQLRPTDLERVAAHSEHRRGEVIYVVRARDADRAPRLADWIADPE